MTDATVTTVPVPPPGGIEAKEASRVVALVTGAVNAVFAGLTTYGITYDSRLPRLIIVLIIALITFAAFIIPIVQGEVTRGKVWSAASVARIAAAVVKDAPPVIAAGEAIVQDVVPPAPAAPVASAPPTAAEGAIP